MRKPGEAQVVWEEEKRILTLEGEPVLKYVLSWPQVEGAGLGGRWISRYYARLAQNWRRRWGRAGRDFCPARRFWASGTTLM